jgi:hypothetical protein
VTDDVGGEIDITIAAAGPAADTMFLGDALAIVSMHGSTGTVWESHGTGDITLPAGIGVASNTQDSSGYYIRIPNSGVNGAAGILTIAGLTRRRYLPTGYFIARPQIAEPPLRTWIGLRSATLQTVDDPGASGIHVAAFKYNPSESANWRTYTSDAATNTITDTGIAVVDNTRRKFGIAMDASSVTFSLDDTVVATHTTTLPGIDTSLQGQASSTRNAGTVIFDLSRVYFIRTL